MRKLLISKLYLSLEWPSNDFLWINNIIIEFERLKRTWAIIYAQEPMSASSPLTPTLSRHI